MSEKPPPAPVAAVAAGRPAREVWENAVGGRTFEVGSGADRCFVKWTPAASGISLADEAARMAWAVPFTPVPRVIGQGADQAGSWLVTAALPGQSAVMPRWQADPAAAVAAIGRGLRAMHDALPVRDCPFSWMAADRLAEACGRARQACSTRPTGTRSTSRSAPAGRSTWSLTSRRPTGWSSATATPAPPTR